MRHTRLKNGRRGVDARQLTRRDGLRAAGAAGLANTVGSSGRVTIGQQPGDRPQRSAALAVLNPMGRVPVNLIVDDST